MKCLHPLYFLTPLLIIQGALGRVIRQAPVSHGMLSGLATEIQNNNLTDIFMPPAPPVHVNPTTMTGEERTYFCYSLEEGLQKYFDLVAATHPAAENFPVRFSIIYSAARQAMYIARGGLDEETLGEDEAITEAKTDAKTDAINRSAYIGPQFWWDDWEGSAERQNTTEDLRSFRQRVGHVDAFFLHLRRARLYLGGFVRQDANTAETHAIKTYIENLLAPHVDRARNPLAQGDIPMRYYPDHETLRRKLDFFQRRLPRTERPTPAQLAREMTAQERRDIDSFYASDSSGYMGAPTFRHLPNLPELDLFGNEGVITFVGHGARQNALKYGPRAHKPASDRYAPHEYAPQKMADLGDRDRSMIHELRFENQGSDRAVPAARYTQITLHGNLYRIGGGPWRRNPNTEVPELETAKYEVITQRMNEARRRRQHIFDHDEPRDERDYTGHGLLGRAVVSMGFREGRGDSHGPG